MCNINRISILYQDREPVIVNCLKPVWLMMINGKCVCVNKSGDKSVTTDQQFSIMVDFWQGNSW